MENKNQKSYNPEDHNSENKQATNRDNSIVNKPTTDSAYESGTNSDRNDQYNAGGTDRITGTTSVSDARNAGAAKQSRSEYDTEDEDLRAQNELDSENLDDESDDFLKGSGRDRGNEGMHSKSNKLDPDFDRNSEV